MNKLRFEQNSFLTRRIALGMAMATTALGASGCGSIFEKDGNGKGLQGLAIVDRNQAMFDQTKVIGKDAVQVDFKVPTALYNNNEKINNTAVECGTYKGQVNWSSVWEDETGMSCRIEDVDDVSAMRKQVRALLNNPQVVQGENVNHPIDAELSQQTSTVPGVGK